MSSLSDVDLLRPPLTSVNPGNQPPLRDELCQPGLAGSIGCLHAAECLRGEGHAKPRTRRARDSARHRPCGFVTEVRLDRKGRERKIYGQYTTPYEKLNEVSIALKDNFLKPWQSFEKLDIMAYQISDNEFAKIMRDKQDELFRKNTILENQLSMR